MKPFRENRASLTAVAGRGQGASRYRLAIVRALGLAGAALVAGASVAAASGPAGDGGTAAQTRAGESQPESEQPRLVRYAPQPGSLLEQPQAHSLLGNPLMAMAEGDARTRQEAALAEARRELAASPGDPEKAVWVGRRLGYLWRLPEAIEIYTQAIEINPDYAPLYRHRGHRYISARQFDRALADLEMAAALIEEAPEQVEQDGLPNARNIPLTTTGFNVWYHLGLAHYLKGHFASAANAYRQALRHSRGRDDNLVAACDWLYMSLRRLGKDDEAAIVLMPISDDMDIIENHAYHRRLLMYKGMLSPEELLPGADAEPLDVATLGYGIGNWHALNGDEERAMGIYRRVVATDYWPAFGYIAAEVELARARGLLEPPSGN